MAQFKTNVVKKKYRVYYRVYGKIGNEPEKLCNTTEIVEAESEEAVRLLKPRSFEIIKIEELIK